MTKTDLSSQIQAALMGKGASLVGFADLDDLPFDIRHSMKYAVSIAVALNPSIIADIKNGPTKKYHSHYKKTNLLLWNLAETTAFIIESNGFKAIPQKPTGVGIDQKTQSTILPHKTVATKSGLGWIGKCALLVTEKYGSAVRLTTVLTDALLKTAIPIVESRCGDCVVCMESCPGNAPRGKNWSSNQHRDLFFDVFACERKAREHGITKVGIDDTICGICIAVCPWTVKYIQSREGI
ncbi:MAG: epoxyqueuosine reductase [candidate division Zixibacteria bacterium]|nr:epoxyqueuosine reductase [candidate division Zixibacteria bacterium]